MENLRPNSNYSFLFTAGPLLLILFIDGMGLGLIIPMLNTLLNPHSYFISYEWATRFHSFLFGSVIGVFMLCWFFGAAILGDLSDQIGRKKSLLICLLGTFFGYFLSAIAVSLHSLSLLFTGRIIAGLTSGSQPIAQAAIVDLSTPEHITRNIGFILTALSLGFILGPLFGGILSDPHIFTWFNLATPFYFAATIALVNAVLLLVLFKESFLKKTPVINIRLKRAWEVFASAFKHEKIRHLSLIFLIFILGWSSFYSFVTIFLVKNYGFVPLEISLFMALMGFGISIGNGFLVSFFVKRYAPYKNVIGGVLISTIFTLIMVYAHYAIYSWILIAPLASAVSIAYANLLALFSNQVSSEAQGWVMGITGAIMALVWGIVAILVGLLATWNVQLPLLLAAASFIYSAFLMYRIHKKNALISNTISTSLD